MFRKKLLVGFFSIVLVCTINADDLANLLQDLAVQTACLGQYSSAETGAIVTSRYDDPPDYYAPPLLANRFAEMSGDMTRITTFYGICFDYAQFAWDDILEYQEAYNAAGMKDQQWYIAAANAGDPYTIILYDPVSEERATTIKNGVYLKEHSRHKVYTHDGISGHAWLWVQHNNGTWYWIDPTWTDNTGYVWWGIVENGKEVQSYPDADYCVVSNYPRPGITGSGTRSPDSTYTADPGQGVNLAHLGYYLGYSKPFDNASEKWGLSFSVEDQFPKAFTLFILSVDWLNNPPGIKKPWTNGNSHYDIRYSESSFIFGTALGYPVFHVFTLYAGGGLGFTMYEYSGYSYKSGSASATPPDDNSFEFAWKVNAGLRFQFSSFFIKADASYGTIMGPSFGIGAGIFL
ncbi:MAG: hypothetical protein LBP20_04640 [Treponema sp.]|jgi:opacity protein-like surface antigen|nr:hypothetical protein [Treponema sp.]